MANQEIKARRAYRQGELLFLPLNKEDMKAVGSDPEGTSYPRWKKVGTCVLREGEATGHKHEVMTETPGTATLLAPERTFMPGLPNMESIGSDDKLLVAEESVEIVHPEHKPLRLQKGTFLVVVQREYDEVRARRIMD